jgi:hypothetical protein
MIGVTGQAAMSIAYRNAVFKVVPRTFVDRIYKKARKVAVGDAHSLAERREKAMYWFTQAGADQATVLAFLGRSSLDEVTLDDLAALLGIVSAIKQGEVSIEAAFAMDETVESEQTDELNQKAKAAAKKPAAKKKAAKKAAPDPEPKPDVEQVTHSTPESDGLFPED